MELFQNSKVIAVVILLIHTSSFVDCIANNRGCNGVPKDKAEGIQCFLEPENLWTSPATRTDCTIIFSPGDKIRFRCEKLYKAVSLAGQEEGDNMTMQEEKEQEDDNRRDGDVWRFSVCLGADEWDSLNSTVHLVDFRCELDRGFFDQADKSALISGGVEATPQYMPWMASIFQDEKYICGGTLIDLTFVLTAAHCTDLNDSIGIGSRPLEQFTVVLGSSSGTFSQATDLNQNPHAQIFKVVQISMHPDFTGAPRYLNDIAILQLEKTVNISKYSTAVQFPKKSQIRSIENGGFVLQVNGFGIHSNDSFSPSKKLLATNVTSRHFAYCEQHERKFDRARQFCAVPFSRDQLGPGHSGICKGDSGGGAYIKDGGFAHQRWSIQGVVSFGTSMLFKGCYNVTFFTKVEFYKSWINEEKARLAEQYQFGQIRYKSCSEISQVHPASERKQIIFPSGSREASVTVLCDLETDGGGWTIIQKRSSGPKEEFYGGWADYEEGFGSLDGNFWIGLKTIRVLTKDRDQELRIDLWDFEDEHAYAKYSLFAVSDSIDFYRLSIGGYSGTAGDSMITKFATQNLDGMRFTTRDKVNDNSGTFNCGHGQRSGWWYNNCASSNLNGLYYEKGEKADPEWSAMLWYNWKNSTRSLRKVEMKIRRRINAKTTLEKPRLAQQFQYGQVRYKSCSEISQLHPASERKQIIFPSGSREASVTVLCDLETDGGGWTIIQKRSSGPKEEFYGGWADYEEGFGSLDGNFWIGLRTIRVLTKDRDQELRIDLWDFEDEHAYAKYSLFAVSDSIDFYRLSIGGYSGTAGDSMITEFATQNLDGMRFTTRDKVNDNSGTFNCGHGQRSGWWYNNCASSNLNGLYYEKGEKADPEWSAMLWYNWKNSTRSLRKVEMKIRKRRK